MTDSFVVKAASLVTAALQPTGSTSLNSEVVYTRQGLISGLKPSVGFLGVILALALCGHVDLYYFKQCSQEQRGAAKVCTHPEQPQETPVLYCKLTFDDRIAQKNGGYGRLNSEYQGPGKLYTGYSARGYKEGQQGGRPNSTVAPGGCLKFEHDFAQEHATYEVMQACGLATLHV